MESSGEKSGGSKDRRDLDIEPVREELSALLVTARIILESKSFTEAARLIFDLCKRLTGATAGYVAISSKDGLSNEVLFLDPGGLPCTVDPSLPMPIRGLREEAYKAGKAVYDNDFYNSQWWKYLPEGHVRLENVLFAPLVNDEKVVGLVGLANKPGGFNDDDLRIVSSVGEVASIGLLTSWTLEALRHSEEQFRSVVQTANDAILSIDGSDKVIFWNRRAELLFGYSSEEIIGKDLTIIMPERFRSAHRAGLNRVLSGGESKIVGKTTVEVFGLKKDGTEFPVELSLSKWKGREEDYFTGVIRDVTDRKALEEEVRIRAEQLEASNRELEAFSYSVSHDLRVPLRAISGFSKILSDDYAHCLDDEGKRFLNIVVENAKRMDLLISDLLIFSRMGRKEIVKTEIDIESLVRTALEELKEGREEIKASVSIGHLCMTRGDRAMIQQVVVNLLSNALKFSSHKEGPVVEVGCYNDKGEKVFFVRDNGVGFDMKYSDKLFGVFQRLHKIEEFDGTGVGLAVTKRIIDRHGGRVWGEGKVNEGATFYFTLPE